jgi:hypothetical protein
MQHQHAAKKKRAGGEVPGKKGHRAFAGTVHGSRCVSHGHVPCLWVWAPAACNSPMTHEVALPRGINTLIPEHPNPAR